MNDEDKLIQELQLKVKESRKTIDDRTLSQLRAARRTAIESLDKKENFWWNFPAAQFAIASIFVVALAIGIMFPVFNGENESYDLAAVAISEDIELLEDLDFYLWLADSIENES